MNKDQIKGTAKDIAGKAQQKIGEITGNTEQQVKGVGNQIAGKVQKGVGNVEHAADEADKEARKNERV